MSNSHTVVNRKDTVEITETREKNPSTQLIEIGWILAGRLDPEDREAIEKARVGMLDRLQKQFPTFQWRMPVLERDELVSGVRIEPTELFEYGLGERTSRHWDFTVVVTGADVVSYQKPYALAVVSRALDSVVISTARLDPRADDPMAKHAERVETMARRISTIALHALGHLNGLSHSSDPDNLMFDVQQAQKLDELTSYSDEQLVTLNSYFQEIADLRLEEQQSVQNANTAWFYAHSAWINRREILNAFLQAEPWKFPIRLSRVTVASLSTMLVMLLTAEAWDLGVSQSTFITLFLPLAVIIATTVYVILRQGLMLRRTTRRLSEQTVLTNVSTFAIVAGGMLATFLSVYVLASLIMISLFRESLVARWAASIPGEVYVGHYLKLAAFVASMGLGVGSLGASFEGQHYFRHVTYVDEEI